MALTTRDRNLLVGLVAAVVGDAAAVAIGVANGHGPHEKTFGLGAITLIVLLVSSLVYLHVCMTGCEGKPTNDERDRCKTQCLVRSFVFMFVAAVAVVWWCEWYRPVTLTVVPTQRATITPTPTTHGVAASA